MSRGDQTKIPNRVGIEQRPAIADEKTEFGHFEIDTVVGRDHQSGTVAKNYSELQKGYFLVLSA
ncbi:hypothetical protein [Piscirickettsia salmonis]|uniref:hypothetical protein n=1 Tax=Piscirickettsia salmonis TaxID=1238 RepID=UPI0008598E30|nr:hypothetical protein [Piscirickettsia salmonis]AOS37038.1 hypothetical protein AVM72_16885 [Piscirickettsia salmonis]APS68591.1 hypothetical protein AVI55_16080 [Piscirickettsia salmonis]APS81750.1 hypothetical protein AVM73_16875 [Piscirickettsia salmonis]